MTNQTDLSLLFKWFDQKLPVTDYKLVGNNVQFTLFDYQVGIDISELPDLSLLDWVLGYTHNSGNPKGYLIDLNINNISDENVEFFIFTESLDQINKQMLEKDWDYLIVRGLETNRNKIHEAIAQRLTKLQVGVERFACRNPCFMIARF